MSASPRMRVRSAAAPLTAALVALALAACKIAPPRPAVPTITQARYEHASFASLPMVADEDWAGAWPAWLASCRVLAGDAREERRPWRAACDGAGPVPPRDAQALRAFFEARFDVYRVIALTLEPPDDRVVDERATGLVTGYYEPMLAGSRTPVAPYLIPLYRVPDDLLPIELGDAYPELRDRKLRGRIDTAPNGRSRVVPYWTRGQATRDDRLRGAELLWVDDALDAFFLQVQGSGRVRLDDGSTIRLSYADSNGQPYRSIGRWLVDHGELTLEQASMQGIRDWARAHPQSVDEMLEVNPSLVFFREQPIGDPEAGPAGALGVALTPGYSVAVDPRFVPLGAPVVLDTTLPSTGAPLRRMLMAQDTGGAIRGPLRFDWFWGTGAIAGDLAGRQRADGSAWLLVPKGVPPEALLPPAPAVAR
ncbi:MAG TPA: murein transglycosylase A [Burkholderiaceae bacterium]